MCLKEGYLANTYSEKYTCWKCHGRHNIAVATFLHHVLNPVNPFVLNEPFRLFFPTRKNIFQVIFNKKYRST